MAARGILHLVGFPLASAQAARSIFDFALRRRPAQIILTIS